MEITDEMVERAAAAIQATKYPASSRPEGYSLQPTDSDRRYARAALEAALNDEGN